MRIQDVDENYSSYLKVSDLENMFSIRKDGRQNYVYNLNETVYFNVSDDDLETYVTSCNSHWPLISYNIYKTTRLAWLLMKLNSVDAKSVFDVVPAGTSVKYISSDGAQSVLRSINGYL